MEQLIDLGMFAGKTLILVMGFITIAATVTVLVFRGRSHRPQLETENLNARFRSYERALQSQVLKKKDVKALRKADRKRAKSARHERRVFVLDFDGDLRAVAAETLREEMTAVLSVATPADEIVVRLESPGGIVAGYGLAAAQLRRARERGIPLTVCVDKVAASGGYMMACVADKIVCAPFAIVGSVGVIAAFANLHRVLEKHDVEYREITAGEFKRTVSLFGEVTPQGLEKFKSQIQDTHELFKTFVQANRPKLDVAHISTGEYWYGTRAKELKLVDELMTSDDYLWTQREASEIIRVRYHGRRNLADRLSESLTHAIGNALERVLRSAGLARFGL
ncbi:MAG: protease SohB [Bdellovibrionaceae bacterium]|nr:protease SohB [Pseudobdellovibrionaceae bacterium]